jgi:hypothetical protein
MAEITSWLNAPSSALEPTETLALNAMRHLSRIERKKLFSPEIEHMRTAEGRWYEAIIYEMFLEISKESDRIGKIAAKGADAPRGRRNIRLGQNGVYYSRCGDITIRGNGQDLAEFDLLLLDHNDSVIFGEVVTSPSDMKEFEKEIEYKKHLLGYLFDQKLVNFLLISSFDISNYSVGRRLLKSDENIHVRTISCEEIKRLIPPRLAREPVRKPNGHHAMVLASDIALKQPFDYQKYHDWERNRVFSNVSNQIDVRSRPAENGTSQLVKKILYGGLYPSAVRTLCHEHEIRIKGEKLEFHDVMRHFSKVILATDLPDYEPLVYLRSKQKKQYLKMVQDKSGNFKFERYTPSKVGFFLWLESLNPTLGSRITSRILNAFSPQNC